MNFLNLLAIKYVNPSMIQYLSKWVIDFPLNGTELVSSPFAYNTQEFFQARWYRKATEIGHPLFRHLQSEIVSYFDGRTQTFSHYTRNVWCQNTYDTKISVFGKVSMAITLNWNMRNFLFGFKITSTGLNTTNFREIIFCL